MFKKHKDKDSFILVVIMTFVLGSLGLAIIDPNTREAFTDLAKIAVSGYLGWMIPRNEARPMPTSQAEAPEGRPDRSYYRSY